MEPDGAAAPKARDQVGGVATEAFAPSFTGTANSKGTQEEQWKPRKDDEDQQK
jgi:hypothetical protein